MMKTKQFNPNDLRVAAPCPVSWESMNGDERSRVCSLCELKVHNIAGMSSHEVENLIGEGSGRICIRVFRRADGTVITKDCPVGVRSLRKRTARMASAALAGLLGLFSVSYGQKNDERTTQTSPGTQSSDRPQNARNAIAGTVMDPHGAAVPGAEIILIKENEKRSPRKASSDVSGKFSFNDLPDGRYRILVEVSGFKKHVIQNIEVRNPYRSEIKVELEPGGTEVIVGIYGEPSMIDITSSEVKTIFSADMLRRLPGGRP
jgi:hypothetical protein